MREEDDVYFEDPEFLEYLQKYEDACKNGESIYMDADELTDIAEYYMMQNREEDANQAIALARSLHPDSVEPMIFLARQQMFHDNLEAAQDIAHSIPDQNDSETIFLWMEILIKLEVPADAMRLVTEKIGEQSEKDAFLYDAASIFIDYGCYDEAAQLVNTLEKEYPDYYRTRKLKIEVLMGKREYEKAIPLLQDYLEEEPYSISAWRTLAEAFVEEANYMDALDSCEYCLAIDPEYQQAMILKAYCLLHLNMMEASHAMYQKVLKDDPQNSNLLQMDANALAFMGRFEEAKDTLKKALKYLPKYDENRIQMLINMAYVEGKCHNTTNAMKALEEAVKLSEKQGGGTEFHLIRGAILLENGKDAEAAKQFELAYQKSPDKQKSLLAIGIAYAETQNYKKAVTFLESIKDKFNGEESEVAIPYLAYCYKNIHDQENFLKYMRHAAKADREITEFLFQKDYPNIQPEEYYMYAFKNAYGRFPTEEE